MLTTKKDVAATLTFSEKDHKYVVENTVISSVTQIVSAFQPKDRFNNWYRTLADKHAKETNQVYTPEESLIIGKTLGVNIRNDTGRKGTKAHKTLENYYLGKVDKPALGKFKPCADLFEIEHTDEGKPCVEHRIFYKQDNYCYAGTLDALMVAKTDTSIWKKGERVIVDYKNPRKAKTPVMQRREGGCYYPFIGYGLQLSAYILGLQYLYEEPIDKALIVAAPQDRKGLSYYYFDKESLDYFAIKFKEMLMAYVDHKRFTWEYFEDEAATLEYVGTKIKL